MSKSLMKKRIALYTKAYKDGKITALEYNAFLEALARIMAGH